ncbi:MAG: restriction endonuclease subunit S [Candidatus Coprenecus sp.]
MSKSSIQNTLAWIGVVPDGWQVVKLRQILSPFSERNHSDMPLLSVVREKGVIVRNVADTEENHNYVPEDLSGYKLVKKGQFAMNKMKAWQGSYGVSKFDGIVSPAYFVFDLNLNINKDFFNRAIRSKTYVSYFGRASDGIRVGQWDLSMQRMKEIPFLVPSRDEQDQIVRFLDWKVSEINKLINIRKRQITELEELKRSKIGNIVMGQSLDVPQKETGVSWVKSIPAHWEERSLIQVAEEQQIKNSGMVEDNLLSLSYGKIINKDINTTDGLLPASFEGYQIVNSGNIVLRLTDLQNDHRSLRTGLATQRGIITSAYTCLKARDNILPEYLQLQLHVADLCKVFYGMGGGVRQSIGFKDIRRLIVAVPPLDEQRDILKAVNGIEVPINSVIAKYQEIILSLEELKTKLISDVITGKIDVRDVVIPDYEYVDEEVDTAEADDGEENTEEQEEE